MNNEIIETTQQENDEIAERGIELGYQIVKLLDTDDRTNGELLTALATVVARYTTYPDDKKYSTYMRKAFREELKFWSEFEINTETQETLQ